MPQDQPAISQISSKGETIVGFAIAHVDDVVQNTGKWADVPGGLAQTTKQVVYTLAGWDTKRDQVVAIQKDRDGSLRFVQESLLTRDIGLVEEFESQGRGKEAGLPDKIYSLKVLEIMHDAERTQKDPFSGQPLQKIDKPEDYKPVKPSADLGLGGPTEDIGVVRGVAAKPSQM